MNQRRVPEGHRKRRIHQRMLEAWTSGGGPALYFGYPNKLLVGRRNLPRHGACVIGFIFPNDGAFPSIMDRCALLPPNKARLSASCPQAFYKALTDHRTLLRHESSHPVRAVPSFPPSPYESPSRRPSRCPGPCACAGAGHTTTSGAGPGTRARTTCGDSTHGRSDTRTKAAHGRSHTRAEAAHSGRSHTRSARADGRARAHRLRAF